MKKLIIFLFLLPLISFGQWNWVEGDSLFIEGGGTFKGIVTLDTNQIKQVADPTDPLDAVNFQTLGAVVIDSFPDIKFYRNLPLPAHRSYMMFADTGNRTISFYIDESEITMQVGQELWLEIKNDNGITFANGVLVYIVGNDQGHPTVMLAHNRDFNNVDAIGMITHDVEAGTFGFVTPFGSTRGLDTSGETPGTAIYVDTLIGGKNWTTTTPVFPDFKYEMGFIQVADASDGVIFINPKGKVDDIFDNVNNANLKNPFDFRTFSNGTTIFGVLSDPDGADSITVRWSDGFSKLAVPDTVEIAAGTNNNSQTSHIYIIKSTEVLTSSTSYFPLDVEIKTIARVNAWSALRTQTEDMKGNQNYNDYTASVETKVGRIAKIGMWQRLQPLKYIPQSGGVSSAVVNTNGGAPDDVYFSITQSLWQQANEQMLPAMDMETGTDIHILNYPDHTDTTISNLNELLIDATGASMAGKSFTIVFWIVQNKTGEASHVFANLPNGSYSSSSSAISDVLGYKVKSIPYEMQSYSGFVAEVTLTHTNPGGGTWVVNQVADIKGDYPFAYASSSSTGGITALTQATDFPNSYSGQAGKHYVINAIESGTEFRNSGAVRENSDTLISGGAAWDFVTATGVTSITDNYVAVGTGTGIEGDPNFTWGQNVVGVEGTVRVWEGLVGVIPANGTSIDMAFASGAGLLKSHNFTTALDMPLNYQALLHTFNGGNVDITTGFRVNGSDYMTSVSTGTADNNKMVTQGYVDDIETVLLDTLAIHLDTLQAHNIRINALVNAIPTTRDLSFGQSYINVFAENVLQEGGTVYPNSAGFGYAYLKALQIEYKTNNWFSPIATKDTILYSIKGGNFASERATTSTGTDPNRVLTEVDIDVAVISYPEGDEILETHDEAEQLLEQYISFVHHNWDKTNCTIKGNPTTVGSDLLSGWGTTKGFQTDSWEIQIGGTIDSETQFTSGGTFQGVKKSDLGMTIGNTYLVTMSGTISDGGTLIPGDYGVSLVYKSITDATFSESFYIYAKDAGMALRIDGVAQTAVINTFTIQEVQGFSSPHATLDSVAFLLSATATNGFIQLTTPLVISNTTDYANSIFIKRVTGTGNILIKDINNDETVVADGVAMANNWFRYSIVSESSSTSGQIGVKLADSGDEVLIFLANTTQELYASSPIVNIAAGSAIEGSTVTRLEDAINSSIYNGTGEDVILYWSGSTHTLEGTVRTISISDGTNTHDAHFQFNANGDFKIFINNVEEYNNVSLTHNEFHKYALSLEDGTWEYYLDGALIDTDTYTGTIAGVDALSLDSYDLTLPFFGNTLQIGALQNLTQTQKEQLTQ